MTLTDLEQVVMLHKQTLPLTVSSKIGRLYLTNLYKKLLSFNNVHLCLVACEDKKIVGVITATKDLKYTQELFSPFRSFHLMPIIIIGLLRGKITIGELFRRISFESKLITKFNSPYATILTFFVKLGNQNQGVGKYLLTKCIDYFRINRTKEIFVDTLKKTPTSHFFYEKCGFKKLVQIDDALIFNLKI